MLTLAIANLCVLPAIMLGAVVSGVALGVSGHADANSTSGLEIAVGLIAFVLIMTMHVVTVFRMRDAMQKEPVGLPLGPVMTFFFGAIYFQYNLQDWSPRTPDEVYGSMNPPAYVPPTAPLPASPVPPA